MLNRRALDREAHLWYLRPENVSHRDFRRCETWLTADERRVVETFQTTGDRRDRLCTKALTRSMLSAYTGVAPGAWRFGIDHHGKPIVQSPLAFRHIRFSVSHTRGLIACLLSTGRAVGVDVEAVDRPIGWLNIGTRSFTATEMSALQRRSPREQQMRFFELWTLKESYAKARGLGLRIPLDGTSFALDVDRRVSVSFSRSVSDDSRRWSFALDTTGTHVMAAAIAEPDVRVVWHATSSSELA